MVDKGRFLVMSSDWLETSMFLVNFFTSGIELGNFEKRCSKSWRLGLPFLNSLLVLTRIIFPFRFGDFALLRTIMIPAAVVL